MVLEGNCRGKCGGAGAGGNSAGVEEQGKPMCAGAVDGVLENG